MMPVLNEYGVLETARQGQVRDLIMKGMTNREIAQALGIKEKSVKWLTGQLYKAWDVKTRHQLMACVFTLERMDGKHAVVADQPPRPLPKGK